MSSCTGETVPQNDCLSEVLRLKSCTQLLSKALVDHVTDAALCFVDYRNALRLVELQRTSLMDEYRKKMEDETNQSIIEVRKKYQQLMDREEAIHTGNMIQINAGSRDEAFSETLKNNSMHCCRNNKAMHDAKKEAEIQLLREKYQSQLIILQSPVSDRRDKMMRTIQEIHRKKMLEQAQRLSDIYSKFDISHGEQLSYTNSIHATIPM